MYSSVGCSGCIIVCVFELYGDHRDLHVLTHSFPTRRSSDLTSGRPGPVNLDVPYNLFQEAAEVAEEATWDGLNRRRSGASPEDVTQVVDWLLAAERPALFIGHGVTLSEAGPELTALAQRLTIPVISSPNGMGGLDIRAEQTGS